ncbi:uncharacterized protein LOC120315570 isoform X3 [Crotalus tigris]|uniref:uncharacterized protein LOC120315570 isoform X3 n=2 Tax=Crotalus tigris TaxID=88082 RepID=UPI00192FAE33|nr:uncharacterized protein LOC120315570 isoform X3 [Crotalus tigris]
MHLQAVASAFLIALLCQQDILVSSLLSSGNVNVLENVDPKTREFLRCLSAHEELKNLELLKKLEELKYQLPFISKNLLDFHIGVPKNVDPQVVFEKNVQTATDLMAKQMGLEQPTPEQIGKAKKIAEVLLCIKDAEQLKNLSEPGFLENLLADLGLVLAGEGKGVAAALGNNVAALGNGLAGKRKGLAGALGNLLR